MSETETDLAGCRTQCKQQSSEILEHLDTINKLNGQIDKLKTSHSQESARLNGVVEEKLADINGLEREIEKCKESISCKSLEIAKLNDSNDEKNNTIKSLENSINQLHQDIEKLKQMHSAEIDEKVMFITLYTLRNCLVVDFSIILFLCFRIQLLKQNWKMSDKIVSKSVSWKIC